MGGGPNLSEISVSSQLDRAVRSAASCRGITLGDELGEGGNYLIVSLLGFSNLSSIWKARDRKSKRNVAVKVLDITSPSHAEAANKERLALSHLMNKGAGCPQGCPQPPDLQQPSCYTNAPPVCCPHSSDHFPRLLDSFYNQSHSGRTLACLVLDRLGNTLQQLLQQRKQEVGDLIISSISSSGQLSQEEASHGLQREPQGLPLPIVKDMVRQLLHALDHLHSPHSSHTKALVSLITFSVQGIVHCDIKPSNIMTRQRIIKSGKSGKAMFSSEGKAMFSSEGMSFASSVVLNSQPHRLGWCLIDFGISHTFQRSMTSPLSEQNSVITAVPPCNEMPIYRTLAYCPPEVLLDVPGGPSPAYDMWGLACITYEAATGLKLFGRDQKCDIDQRCDKDQKRTGWLKGFKGWAYWPWQQQQQGYSSVTVVRSLQKALVDPDEEERHLLQLMVQTLGPPPEHVLDRSRDRRLMHFVSNLDSQHPPAPPQLDNAVTSNHPSGKNSLLNLMPLLLHGISGSPQFIPCSTKSFSSSSCADVREGFASDGKGTAYPSASLLQLRLMEKLKEDCCGLDQDQLTSLASFMQPLLQWDPQHRPNARDMMSHYFLQ